MARYDASFLELTFASKERVLFPRRFAIHEGLSTLFEVNVMALSKDYGLDLEKYVGQNIGFRIMSGVAFLSSPGRHWTGVCSLMEQVRPEATGESTYFIRVVPRLWLLTQRRGHRVFQRATLPEIVQKVLEEWKIKPQLELRKSYLKHDYVVQYGETDYDFICRLLEWAGISYYFKFDAEKETELALSDEPHQGPEREAGSIRYTENPNQPAEKEFVARVRVAQSVTPGDFKIRDFDFRRRPDFKLFGDAVPTGAPENFYQGYHYLPGSSLRIDPPDGTKDSTPVADDRGKVRASPDAIKQTAQISLEAARRKRRKVVFTTNCLDLTPGVVVAMRAHPRSDLSASKKLLLTNFSLDGHVVGEWTFVAEAVFADQPFRPAMSTPKPRIRGLQSAVVVGPKGEEIYTDEFGRVRVQFHWDREGKYDDESSCWMRVSQAWAGAGFGHVVLPRVGQEVLVGFLDGDPDQPLVVGRAYNKTNPVPYKLPDHKTRSGWRSRSSPKRDGFNEIMFEDKKGEELFYVQAELDLQKLTKREEVERTFESRSLIVGKNRAEVIRTVDATMVGEKLTLQMIKPPSKSDLKILEQREPKVSPRPTKIEMKDKQLLLTTGRATVSFEDKNLIFEAEKNITIHAEGGDVVLEGSRALINTVTPPAALSGKDIVDPDLVFFSPPPTKKPGLLSRMKTALVGALKVGAKVAVTLKTWKFKLAEYALRAVIPVINDRFLKPKIDQKPLDGQFVGKDCKPSPKKPGEGVVPKKCAAAGKKPAKKIYYVNGINTDLLTDGSKDPNNPYEGSGFCGNMHAIADADCAEVIGVYNATEGMGRDLTECLDNIGRAGKTPAAKTLSEEMMRNLTKEPPEKMTLFAHSQGGLVTQEALIDTKAQLVASGMTEAQAEQRMSNLDIKSFGTALMGWPQGPQYERFTNLKDPVPYAIAVGQGALYPVETVSDTSTPGTHVYADKNWLFDAHSMDGSYMVKYAEMQDQKAKETGQPRCDC